jgi:hypothetical protein
LSWLISQGHSLSQIALSLSCLSITMVSISSCF